MKKEIYVENDYLSATLLDNKILLKQTSDLINKKIIDDKIGFSIAEFASKYSLSEMLIDRFLKGREYNPTIFSAFCKELKIDEQEIVNACRMTKEEKLKFACRYFVEKEAQKTEFKYNTFALLNILASKDGLENIYLKLFIHFFTDSKDKIEYYPLCTRSQIKNTTEYRLVLNKIDLRVKAFLKETLKDYGFCSDLITKLNTDYFAVPSMAEKNNLKTDVKKYIYSVRLIFDNMEKNFHSFPDLYINELPYWDENPGNELKKEIINKYGNVANFSSMLHIDPSYIAHIINGTKPFSMEKTLQLCKKIGVLDRNIYKPYYFCNKQIQLSLNSLAGFIHQSFTPYLIKNEVPLFKDFWKNTGFPNNNEIHCFSKYINDSCDNEYYGMNYNYENFLQFLSLFGNQISGKPMNHGKLTIIANGIELAPELINDFYKKTYNFKKELFNTYKKELNFCTANYFKVRIEDNNLVIYKSVQYNKLIKNL